jgi:hypothetical protein
MLCQPVDSYSAALAVIAIQSALLLASKPGADSRSTSRLWKAARRS